MTDINNLFFELIRVAIGNQVCLSRTPSKVEWQELQAMAKKQSLVGICFAGVQKLNTDLFDNNSDRCSSFIANLSESLRLQWMGMAAKIQQRNEVVNRRCVEMDGCLRGDGFGYAILKGQGVASLYSINDDGLKINDLSLLRQSGDIDVLLWKDGMTPKENRIAVLAYARTIDKDAFGSAHHTAVHMFRDIEVELHYEASYMCNPWANKRLQEWMRAKVNPIMDERLGCSVPSVGFNLVFLLAHIFRHYVSEGVGLRQMMDYYFVLRTQINGERLRINDDLLRLLDSFNMLKFAGAAMWVLKEVFGLERECMICEPNERLGKKLLWHIMQGGNFGHHNTDKVMRDDSHIGNFLNQLSHDLQLAVDYPSEALWSPLSMIREFLRIRI